MFDRGLLRAGMQADVTVFDPEKIADRAVVNGVVVLEGERHTGARPGQVLYGAGADRPSVANKLQ